VRNDERKLKLKIVKEKNEKKRNKEDESRFETCRKICMLLHSSFEKGNKLTI